MASKKKKKGLFDYVSNSDIKKWKKKGAKPKCIKAHLQVWDMNIDIVKKRNKKSII